MLFQDLGAEHDPDGGRTVSVATTSPPPPHPVAGPREDETGRAEPECHFAASAPLYGGP